MQCIISIEIKKKKKEEEEEKKKGYIRRIDRFALLSAGRIPDMRRSQATETTRGWKSAENAAESLSAVQEM